LRVATVIDRTPRHHVLLSRAIMDAVQQFRFAHQIETRTEAIERLIRAGLDAAKKPVRRKAVSPP
jgi:hypothetical protein